MKRFLFFILLLMTIQVSWAREPKSNKPSSASSHVDYRGDCSPGIGAVDLNINNVRARLLSRGDFWWDYSKAQYIVPNVDPASGQDEVSSIYTGGVWMGGFDPAGNLKLAATLYANTGKTDYYPGPLDPESGGIDDYTCEQWDRHFEVRGSSITQWKAALAANPDGLDASQIPDDLKYYPARGNPYFLSQPNGAGFELPDQDLASFHDHNNTGFYDPLDGDYPVIEIRGCPLDNYADQMFFQIYNDNGGPHSTTSAKQIRMEVQVQAFGFATSDELNDMTFMRYKLINRAQDTISDCYFAMWVDADLGCSNDDYIGCDTSRSLAYYYNSDDTDGNSNCSCEAQQTYCKDIPMIGIDYFRGPIDELGNELGMSSFTYHNREGSGGTTDPGSAAQFYNYLTGKWKDGTPVYGGGDGYQDPAYPETKFVFYSPPNDPTGWSMAQEGLASGDRRTVQASGPFVLEPGRTNELIIGLPWVPNVTHPNPDITRLLAADDKAQNLFDACFDITDGPDAPDMEIVELNQEIVITLDNSELSNNFEEAYEEEDLAHKDEFYHFEGYQIYQTISSNVSLADLDNTDVSRLVGQCDVKNGIAKLYNWATDIVDPNDPTNHIYVPEERVAGADKGIKHSFSFKVDKFGTGNSKLINHRKYYYVAIAYAYNQFAPFEPPSIGQPITYLAGRKTAYGSKILPVTAIPRPSTYSLLESNYGDGPLITRISGSGTGGHFLEISKETRESAVTNPSGNILTYLPGKGPFIVKVINPLKVIDGKYRLYITDYIEGAHSIKDAMLYWVLESLDANGNIIKTDTSSRDLAYFNEEILSEYGISIEMGQIQDAGESPNENFGAVGMKVDYQDLTKPLWLLTAKDDQGVAIVQDGEVVGSLSGENINFVLKNETQPAKAFTSSQATNDLVAFYPFSLLNTTKSNADAAYFVSPGWTDSNGPTIKLLDSIYHLNNVDIVFTKDKEKWSRCVITEAANSAYGLDGVSIPQYKPAGNRKQFYLRNGASVSKDMNAETGLPEADGSGTEGFGWFPGYAVDVETGKRLNIFFSENSTYRNEPDFYPPELMAMFGPKGPTGGDMMFNPTDVQFVGLGAVPNPQRFEPNINSMVFGGQHFVYVTYDEYDGCQYLWEEFSKPQTKKRIRPLSHIQWAGLVMAAPGTEMLSYADGLIPNDVVVSLRANNPYNTVLSYTPTVVGQEIVKYGELPTYEFEFNGFAARELDAATVDNALDEISVVPNPYYGYSHYERSQFTTIVKVTNLPAKCTVTIYSLDGKFIKKFERNEVPAIDYQTGYSRQIAPDVEWDLKNASGIPVSSGVYLIHINAPGLGERVIKWFGMNRQFDPSGL